MIEANKIVERIGLIDLGSNTARLVIFDVLEGGYFMVADEMVEAVRLGETEIDGSLKQTRVMQAINTVKVFKKLCAVFRVDKILAVATAAVRRAKNQRTFLNEMFGSTGLKFKVVSEEEEANLVYQGVINSMEIPKGLIMEIGGSGTQFVYYNRRNILHTEVFSFGAATLAEMFGGADVAPEETERKVAEFFRQQLETVDWLDELDPETQFIGVGGSFRNLSALARRMRKYPLDMTHNYNLPVTDLNAICDMLRTADPSKKNRIKGLTSVRADVFPCALTAIKCVADTLGFSKIITSACGLREGIMFNYAVPLTLEKPITDVLGHSILTYLNYLGCNVAHAEQVYNLTIQLFKQLRVLHKFPRMYVRVLRVAALLNEVGKTFKYYDNARHAAYMILNSNLYGISHRDIVLAAYVTDVFNKNEAPLTDWDKFREKGIITDEDVEAVKKLAVILGLAVAFDRSNAGVIMEINCDVLGDSVIMKTEVIGDTTLEMRDANRCVTDFRKVFKKNLDII